MFCLKGQKVAAHESYGNLHNMVNNCGYFSELLNRLFFLYTRIFAQQILLTLVAGKSYLNVVFECR